MEFVASLWAFDGALPRFLRGFPREIETAVLRRSSVMDNPAG
jgi:hypothetical protein